VARPNAASPKLHVIPLAVRRAKRKLIMLRVSYVQVARVTRGNAAYNVLDQNQEEFLAPKLVSASHPPFVL